jgi:toxin ParE1/3/4
MQPRPAMPVTLAPAAEQDIRELLRWSVQHFGTKAAARYTALLYQALRDPERIGVQTRPDLLTSDARTYHLSFSRYRVNGPAVKNPRHLILFRIVPPILQIARVIHDSRDLSQHLPESYRKT